MESITIFRSNAAQIIAEKFRQTAGSSDNYVFLCIGTAGVVSDSLGPKVGSLVTDRQIKPTIVYGTLDSNITAQNLPLAIDFIRALHPDKKIAVVDAAVGDSTEVGCVQILNDGISPGAATDKNLPKVGDVSVLGVVSMRGAKNFYSSHDDRICLVQKIAEVISDAIVCSA